MLENIKTLLSKGFFKLLEGLNLVIDGLTKLLSLLKVQLDEILEARKEDV